MLLTYYGSPVCAKYRTGSTDLISNNDSLENHRSVLLEWKTVMMSRGYSTQKMKITFMQTLTFFLQMNSNEDLNKDIVNLCESTQVTQKRTTGKTI